jgi:hypothetical protein
VTDEEFDDALDDLPAHKRKQILRLVSDEERAPKLKLKPNQVVGRSFVVILAFFWSIPFSIVGVALLITVIAAPLGLLLLAIGGWPLYRAVKSWIGRDTEKEIGV